MAISTFASGNNTANTTEWSLVTNTSGPDSNTTAGIYQTFIDTNDMVAGDQLQIKVYEAARSGGTQRAVYQSILTGAQGEPIWASPSLILQHGWDFTVKVLAGTTIIVDWSIRQVA